MPKYKATNDNCSEHQRRLWFIDNFERDYLYVGGPVYHNLPCIVEIPGTTDIARLNTVLKTLLDQCDFLRVNIRNENGLPLQIINKHQFGGIETDDISNTNHELEVVFMQHINISFDIENDLLVRFKLIKRHDQLLFLIVTHHLLADRKALTLLTESIINNLSSDVISFNNIISNDYRHYTAWQNSYLQNKLLASSVYWKRKLRNIPVFVFETDKPRDPIHVYEGALVNTKLNASLSKEIVTFCDRRNITPYRFFLTVFNTLLFKLTGAPEIVVGTVYENRDNGSIASIIGPVSNLLSLNTTVENDDRFSDYLAKVSAELNESIKFSDYPFENAVLDANPEKDMSRTAIFDLLFQYEESSITKQNIQVFELNYGLGKYDLNLLVKKEECFTLYLRYNKRYFEDQRIERFLNQYTNILPQVTRQPDVQMKHLEYLSAEEEHELLTVFNDSSVSFPGDKTLVDLFEEQAERTPSNIAIVYENDILTYQQLNERSNQLADYLREEFDIKPDDLIGIKLERSTEMLIAILGIIKSGAAYVPIDPTYPDERINYIITDCKCKVVIDAATYDNFLTRAAQYKTRNPKKVNEPSNIAYVIYTSGSTGNPKGVMVEHRNVVRLFQTDRPLFTFSSSDVWTMFHSYCFDFSVWEMYGALLHGGKLIVVPYAVTRDPNLFLDVLIDNQVTVLNQTPSSFYNIIKQDLQREQSPLSLRYVIFGGEALSPTNLKGWKNKYPHIQLINMYGITETTVHVTYKEITLDEINQSISNIGKPIPTLTTYVLDRNQHLLPVGSSGELYIGGAGLAKGYLNNERLTNERFITNPFATEGDKKRGYTRLYKSGDVGRWLSDGNLEYIGRNDDQVKIRGFRIELGEIEYALKQVGGISQCCVLVRDRKTEAGDVKDLIGYYVADSTAPAPTEILDRLTQMLPDYMVPSALVPMESFPLTVNGKLDKRLLPDPNFRVGNDYVAPITDVEVALCGLWQDILGIERVGVTDDFFMTGGNSILAIQVSHRMSKLLGRDVKVADIFKRKTISQLLIYSLGKEQVTIPKNETDRSVLSFAQERLWFIEQYEEGTNAYHIPAVFELAPETDAAGIKHSIQQIIRRHEILRSTIEQGEAQQGIQVVHTEPLFIGEVELTDQDDHRIILQREINRPFDLSKEYPIRVNLYRIKSEAGEERRLLLINTHHIASDGWSLDIFHKELFAYYEAYLKNDAAFNLPTLEIQYKDYAIWQRSYLTGEILKIQLSYWKQKLSGYQSLELRTDYPRPNQTDYKGAFMEFALHRDVSQKLRALAKRYGITLHSVLLSSINILLGKYTGQEDIVIGSPIANRHHRQTEGLIGFFINTQANRTLLSKTQSFEELIQQVHQEQTTAQLYQDLPFEKLVDELGVERDASRHPVFQVLFAVQRSGLDGKTLRDQRAYFRPFQGSVAYEVAKLDLSIYVDDGQEALTGIISFATSLFRKESIARLIRHYTHLIDLLTEAPQKAYSQLSLLRPEEYNQIIYEWNNTGKE